MADDRRSDLLDAGCPFLMEKPMGISAAERRAGRREGGAQRNAFVAVPLAQRVRRLRLARSRTSSPQNFRPAVAAFTSRINRPAPPRYAALGLPVDARSGGSRRRRLRNLGSHGLDMFCHLTGEEAQVTGAQLEHAARTAMPVRGLRLGHVALGKRHSRHRRRSAMSSRATAPTASGRSPAATPSSP